MPREPAVAVVAQREQGLLLREPVEVAEEELRVQRRLASLRQQLEPEREQGLEPVRRSHHPSGKHPDRPS